LLQERIPHGGPVELYHALDRQLQRLVTVQMLSAHAADDVEMVRRFRSHQQAAGSLHHPSICEVYDAGEWEGRPYSVMEKDSALPASSLYREDGEPPDMAAALRVTRQVAEALQHCRDSGLADWAFSYRAVRLDNACNAHLLLVEGLDQAHGNDEYYTSTSVEDDPRALSGLLRVMMVGNPDPRAAGLVMLSLPQPIQELLSRLYLEGEGHITSAGEAAQAIASMEAAHSAPTEAYGPDMVAATAPGDAPTLNLAEQPTMVTVPPPTAYVPDGEITSEPHAPVEADSGEKGRNRLPIILPLLGLLLLAGLVAAFWPRQALSGTPVEEAVAAPAPTTPPPLLAPDLRGKSLPEAQIATHAAGLNLAQADTLYDAAFPKDTIARQQPEAGAQVQPGAVITVNLSLGAEPQVAFPERTPEPQPPIVIDNPTPKPQTDQQPPAKKPSEDKKSPPGKDKDDGDHKGNKEKDKDD
ncbi:MAG TPA: PASTA domain-containing protein, partial [Chloroflexia bacterium]|nr:PASTA domain-containing protein [Chloroflexia bacterium]